MKKLIFTTLSTLAILTSFAQVMQQQTWDLKLNPWETNIQTPPIPQHSGVFSKTSLEGTLDNANRITNAGYPQDQSGSSTPTANTWRINYPVIFPDSFVRIAYKDQTTGNNTNYTPYLHMVGYLFDPRSIYWDPMNGAPANAKYITNFTPYTIDSVTFLYSYQRYNPNNSIIDTMVFQFYYPTYSSSDTVHNSPFVDVGIQNSSNAYGTLKYDYTKNLGTQNSGKGTLVTQKLPMTIDDTCVGGTYGRFKSFALTSPINLQSRTRFAVTFKYAPSLPYAVNDTIDGDSDMMVNVKKLNNNMQVAHVYDYSNFTEAVNSTYPVVDRAYNNTLLVRTAARYNYTNQNGWNGMIYPAGFSNTSGLSYAIFPYLQVHVTNVTKLGVNDQNKIFKMSQVYPNPSTGLATISFDLRTESNVKIELFNMVGQSVKTFANQSFNAGLNEFQMNLSGIPSGVYFINMTVNGSNQTQKLTVTE